MEYKIIHDAARNRFEIEQDDLVAYVEYRVEKGGIFDILHTVVPKPLEGRGIAAALVSRAYEHAFHQGLHLKATCSYAEAWLRRHPDF